MHAGTVLESGTVAFGERCLRSDCGRTGEGAPWREVKEDYETLKAGLKKRLPIFTPHATFKNGRRLNADAVPSGLSMYDIDHLPNPREYWVEKSQELSVKNVLRFVVLAHVTPSTEGLRLFFIIPDGMDLAQAQKWMSEQLGDANYDQSVKDLARSSFVVPEEYIIYIDEDKLFADNCRGVSHTPECVHDDGKDNCQLSIVNCQLSIEFQGDSVFGYYRPLVCVSWGRAGAGRTE